MEQTTESIGAEAPADKPLSNVTASDTPAMLTAIANGEELQIVWEDYTLELRIQD